MRQTYLTSDNPTVVNRLRKGCHEYARQRELEEWFENIHHVRLAWKEDADGKRTVEGVEAVTSKETLTVQGKGDLKGHWLMPMNGLYKPCKDNNEVWRMLRQFEWRPDPLPGIVSSYTYTPYVDMYVEDDKAYLSMPVESWDESLWHKTTKGAFHKVEERFNDDMKAVEK